MPASNRPVSRAPGAGTDHAPAAASDRADPTRRDPHDHSTLARPSRLGAVALPWHPLERRARFFVRTLRADAPLAWRMAAHGAVLLLTIGVFLASRLQLARTAEASLIQPRTSGATAEADLTAILQAQPVLGAPSGPAEGGPEPAEAAAAGGPDAAGFLSPGPIAEADPLLLPWEEPQSYTVQGGDTIFGIAAHFGIDAEALLHANPSLAQNPNSLKPGDQLTILPINGVLHVVAEGDTLEALAEKYKVTADDIVSYPPNDLRAGEPLVIGAQVVVPGGQMEVRIPSYYQMIRGNGSGAAEPAALQWSPGAAPGGVAGTGQFYVAAYGRVTQGYRRYHQGIDIANRTGTPIYAIDSGTVEAAGWLGWAGNAVVIDHGNGFKSLYAHMSSLGVQRGQAVQRGQPIGGIGCTRGRGGRCTGPHLHLEVFYNGAHVNPCSLGGVCP